MIWAPSACRPGRVRAAVRRTPDCAPGPQLARRHTQWRRVRPGTVMPRAVQRLLAGSVAIPGSSGESAAGRLAGTALLGLLLVGGLVLLVGDRFEPCRFVSSGDALEHGEVAHEVSLAPLMSGCLDVPPR